MQRLVLFLLFFWPTIAWAIPDFPLENRRMHLSSERRGHNSAIAAAHDPDGYLWLATIRGLYVYDGQDARQVLADALNGTKINGLHIDGRGALWLATNTGIFSYGVGRPEPVWHQIAAPDSHLNTTTTHVIYEDRRGTIWAGIRRGGLYRHDPSFDAFQRVPFPPSEVGDLLTVYDIKEDANRDLWVATDRGLFRMTGNQPPVTRIPLAGGEKHEVRKIAFDGQGNLWAAVMSQGLWTVPADSSTLQLTRVPEFARSTISELYTDKAGDVWIASINGLYRAEHRSSKVFRHPLLPNDYIGQQPVACASIGEDAAGNLWIGTYRHGIFQTTPRPASKIVKLVDAQDGRMLLDTTVYFNAHDQRLYVAPGKGGLYRSEPMSGHEFMLSGKLVLERLFTQPKIKSVIHAADQSLLLGSIGLLELRTPQGTAQSIVVERADINSSNVNAVELIHAESNGRIWFRNPRSLFNWMPTQHRATRVFSAETSTLIYATFADPLIYFSHYPRISTIDIRTGHIADLDPPADIIGRESSRLALYPAAADVFLIASAHGLNLWNQKSGQTHPIHDPAGNPIIRALSFHRHTDQSVWVHTQDKVLRIPQGSHQASHALQAAADTSASVRSKPAVFPDGKLCYGHSAGLFMVDPEQVLAQKPSQTIIAEVRVFDKTLPVDQRGRVAPAIRLTHEDNYLVLTFANPQLAADAQPHFFYMLEGVDTTWQDAGTRNSVSYAHLAPGSYVFRVREGLGQAHPTSLAIVIEPPWWKTSWALALYVIAGVAVSYALLTLFSRIQTARIRREMLEQLVMQDPLTGIPNRRKFQAVLAAEKSRCKRTNHDIAVIMIDIDFFKGFNDRFGHQAGDEALKRVATSLQASLRRPEDFVARYGGEEFVIVLPSTDQRGAEKVALNVQKAIFEANIPYPGSPMADRVTVSLGISTFKPQSDLHIEAGLFSADQALYQAKRNGRNCIIFKRHSLSLSSGDSIQEITQPT